jgi:hypothetical protein
MSDTPGSGPFGQPAAFGQSGDSGQPAAFGQPRDSGQPGQSWPPRAADLGPDAGPAPVLVSFPGPTPQPQLTVAFRAILAIPQLAALSIVSAVGAVVAFIGWWAALFTGRLPDWVHQLLAGLVRWSARVTAYLYLVTGSYPPFSPDDSDYPVRVLTKPTGLNRLAVLFRYFLMLPVGIVAGMASIGLAVLSVVAWVITVITGRMPTAMHQAFSAIIRFGARYVGYAYMVTPEYPAGLYGDQPEPALGATSPGFAASPAAVDASPFPTAAPQYAPPARVQAPPASGSANATVQAGDPWRLVLSSRAKTLVTASLVIGAIVLVASIVFFASLSSPGANTAANRANALAKINSAYGQLDSVLRAFPGQTAACGQDLSCVTALDGKVATAFQSFETSLQQSGVPTAYSGDEGRLATDTGVIAVDFRRLASAHSASEYEGIVDGMNITSTLGQWQADFNGLESALTKR